MIQQGQVFRLKAKCADGEPLWAYRYRVAGRTSRVGEAAGGRVRRVTGLVVHADKTDAQGHGKVRFSVRSGRRLRSPSGGSSEGAPAW
jgi:hypothetical protein